jgi:hypothetical protein
VKTRGLIEYHGEKAEQRKKRDENASALNYQEEILIETLGGPIF